MQLTTVVCLNDYICSDRFRVDVVKSSCISVIIRSIFYNYSLFGMNSSPPKKKVLQMMSTFATMRFELKNTALFNTHKHTKKNLFTKFTRFSKSQHKQPQTLAHAHARPTLKRNNSEKKAQKDTQLQNNTLAEESDSAFSLKFLDKFAEDTIIVGNQYQLDLLKIGSIYDDFIEVEYKSSIQPQLPISSVSIEQKYGLLAISTSKTLQIRKYNAKRQHQFPLLLLKAQLDDGIEQIRFSRNLGLFVVWQSKIEFHRLSFTNEKLQIQKGYVHIFDNGPNFKLYFVPQTIQNSLNLYFYQNKVKPEEMSKFGLWMQTIEANTKMDASTMGKLTLLYNINVKKRKQFHIYNYSREFCLIKFPYNIIAIKNGYVIDQAYTNFRKENSFIEYIEKSHTLLHYRSEHIDIYKLSMNLNVKPERIALDCVDSFQFAAPTNSKLYQIISLNPQKYAIFYEQPASNLATRPQLLYSFSVSYEVNLKKKIDNMYLKDVQIESARIQDLTDKCLQANKFGMTNQEAFFELWKRSNKQSVIDYQILIGTKDFDTIEQEVEKKLKKQSMSVRQLIKIYTESLIMLKQRVLSPSCTVQSLTHYSTCHFLLRKFELYRYLRNEQKKQACNQKKQRKQRQKEKARQCRLQCQQYGSSDEAEVEEQSNQVLMINIKDFYEYSEMSVLNQLVDLIGNYLNKRALKNMKKIKAILIFFKLIFRLNYKETIEKIINSCKMRLIQIVAEIPQLLPCHCEEESMGLGLWATISQEQLDQYLFINQLQTLENKDKIGQFTKNIWFKRNININHGVILVAKQKYQQFIHKQYNFEDVFYRILFNIYNLRIYDQSLRKLIIYIETKYKLMPAHLKGKFELYVILYEMFESINREHTLQTFLKFKEFQLFKMYFQREKIEKNGFILRKIMPLYSKVLKNGNETFNQGIFNYFSVEESSVADLKCILNKLNNEKNEFHMTAQKLYQVLVEAIMIKIKIGSASDTPIEQILVYIQNIPFPIHNQSIMTNLEYIQEINYESQILRTIKVNMSLQQIVDNPTQVIEMMVNHQIKRYNVHAIRDYRTFRVYAYKILADIQCKKCNIYADRQHQHSLKTYLLNVMDSIETIRLCAKLLKDQQLIEEFGIDTEMEEEVIITLYHRKLSNVVEQQDKYFLTHRDYLLQLCQILQIGSFIRCFIELSIKYAELLSFKDGFKIEYPIFNYAAAYPTLNDFIETITCMQAKQLAQLDLQAVFKTIMQLKKLKDSQVKNSQQLQIYQRKLKVEVYESLIVHLIEVKELHAALENLFTLITLQNDYPQFNIIFPALIIEHLLPELLQNTCLLLIKLISYYYYSPLELAHIIKHLLTHSFTNLQLNSYLNSKIKEKETQMILSFSNPTITEKLQIIDTTVLQNRLKLNEFIEWSIQRVVQSSDTFAKNYQIYIMLRLMCHNPIAISKWIWCKKSKINVKTVRSLISFMSLEAMSNSEIMLQQGRKIFEILRFKYKHSAFFNEIIKCKNRLDEIELNQMEANQNTQQEQNVIQVLTDSIQLFLNKLQSLKVEHREIIEEKEQADFSLLIKNPQQYYNRPRSQYIYNDLDDGYEKANDFLLLNRPKKKQNSAVNSLSEKDSSPSEKNLYNLIVPQMSKTIYKNRKYSDYFPEMIDMEPKNKQRELKSSMSQTRLKSEDTKKQFKIPFNFPGSEFADKIIEDPADLIESVVQIGLNFPTLISQNSKEAKESEKSLNIEQKIPQQILQICEIVCQNNSEARLINLSIAESRSINSNSMSSSQSHINFNFNLTVTQANKSEPMLAEEMAKQLLSDFTGNSQTLDLSQLKSMSNNYDFRVYLIELLQKIYCSSQSALQVRLGVILAIAHTFQSQHFEPDCLQLFQRMYNWHIQKQIPEQMTALLPVNMIMQESINQAFELFLSNVDSKVDMFYLVDLVEQAFCRGDLKDQLITRYIVLAMRDSLGKTQQDQVFKKLMSLFAFYDDIESAIQQQLGRLCAGDTSSRKLALKLASLASRYKQAKQI